MANSFWLRRQKRAGFTQIELIISGVVGIIGIWAAASIFSYVERQNKASANQRAASSAVEAIREGLATDMKAAWLDRSAHACVSGTSTISFASFDQSPFTVTLLNQAQLQTLVPTTIGGVSNPYRTAINALIANYGVEASKKCTDASVYVQPQYSALTSSPPTLCRCATASTFYGTLAPRPAKIETQKGLYACALIAASSSATSESQSGKLLSAGPLVTEIAYSLFNPVDNSIATCLALGGVAPPRSVSRVYFSSSYRLGSTSSASEAPLNGFFMTE